MGSPSWGGVPSKRLKPHTLPWHSLEISHPVTADAGDRAERAGRSPSLCCLSPLFFPLKWAQMMYRNYSLPAQMSSQGLRCPLPWHRHYGMSKSLKVALRAPPVLPGTEERRAPALGSDPARDPSLPESCSYVHQAMWPAAGTQARSRGSRS